ncbi:hypothetical protein MKW94_026292 [Papaver nudicaule]|uniref:Uncharacterized protein n=1 Tax=Papaver nudicaule TaxID=74823 RepID=A0AA41VMT7_PAPNU|nr:hypothetical protein [Papaver nudicaule]
MEKNSFPFGFLLVVVLIVMTNYYEGGVAAGQQQVCDGNILGTVLARRECRNCVAPCNERFNNVVRIQCAPYGFDYIQCFCCGPVTTQEFSETS